MDKAPYGSEERFQQDIDELKNPERYKEQSQNIADLNQAIDILTRIEDHLSRRSGKENEDGWYKIHHAIEFLQDQLEKAEGIGHSISEKIERIELLRTQIENLTLNPTDFDPAHTRASQDAKRREIEQLRTEIAELKKQFPTKPK